MKTYLAKEWKWCALFVLITLPLAFLAPYKSYVIQWLIDAESAAEIPRLLALGGAIFLSVFLLEWAERNIFSHINTSVARAMREELLDGILSRDLGTFKRETVGSYVSQLTNDITAIQNEFLSPLYNIVLYGGMLIFSLFFLYRIHPMMFLIAVAMAIFPAVIPHVFARHLKKSRAAFSRENASYVTVSKDVLQGFETLRSFGAEENAARQHHIFAAALARAELCYNKIINCNIATTSFIGQVVFYLVLAIGILLVFSGDLTIGYLVTATNLINFTNQPVQIISQSVSKIIATKEIRRRLAAACERAAPSAGTGTMPNGSTLTLAHIRFRYGEDGAWVLNDISYTFEEGKKYALVGASGAGKSTLAKVIAGMYNTFEGSITCGGKDVRTMTRQEFTRTISIIPQSPFLFNGTVLDNITLFSGKWTEDEVLAAAQQAGLGDLLAALPQGLHSEIVENSLSGGQAQRIGIARALLRKPDILLADEPTANLDSSLADDIERLLMDWHGTAILITHRKSELVLGRADDVLEFANGTIIRK